MKLENILLDDDVVTSINDNLDYLLDIIPEIKNMIGFNQKNPHHHLDVWEHTLLALSLSEKNYDIRLALLLHDIGKPRSCQDGETRHFKGHQIVSAEMSRMILKKLGYHDIYVDRICYLILNHDSPITTKQIEKNYELTEKLYEIQKCDALAHHPDKLEPRKEYLGHVKQLLKR